ncbi:MAG: DUF4262 domain-containing protein [Pseudonocardiaceae bacterium]|nr:DUF4262 domain-containing protein [Pseudonocardiaceae bacterium]
MNERRLPRGWPGLSGVGASFALSEYFGGAMETPEQLTHFRDQYNAWERDVIRTYGWAIQYVLGDEDGPPFAYTVGLSGFDHPELIAFGLGQQNSAALLNDLGERVRAGETLRHGQLVSFAGWAHHAVLVTVPDSSEHLLGANAAYRSTGGPAIPALQAVYNDVGGRFPWHDGYTIPSEIQPVLGSVPSG